MSFIRVPYPQHLAGAKVMVVSPKRKTRVWEPATVVSVWCDIRLNGAFYVSQWKYRCELKRRKRLVIPADMRQYWRDTPLIVHVTDKNIKAARPSAQEGIIQ